MEFSEGNENWSAVPGWAEWLIRLGYLWANKEPGIRRIGIVSMPCDSAAAGLVTLGAFIRDLGNPRANNSDRHYDHLLQYARQHLEFCLPCDVGECDPEAKGCGFTSEAAGRVRHVGQQGTYEVSGRSDLDARQIAFTRRGVTTFPKPLYAADWYIDGEPAPETNSPEGELDTSPYEELIPNAPLSLENARKSYSGLCLAGRTAGESSTRTAYSNIRLRKDGQLYTLDSLLTIYGWSKCAISRVSYFNTLTENLDRNQAAPALVVADGDGSFLNALGWRTFRQSDVVGVIHRTIDRDKLEAVGNKILQQNQWYDPDTELLQRLPPAPRGISALILKREAKA